MEKVKLCMLTIISMLTTSSCTTRTSTIHQMGESIDVGHFNYVVKSISFKKSIGDEFFRETADGIYLVVKLSIKNISRETRTLDGSLFAVKDMNGITYEHSSAGIMMIDDVLFLKDCQPNIKTSGSLIFEVPSQGTYYLDLSGDFWGRTTARVLLK